MKASTSNSLVPGRTQSKDGKEQNQANNFIFWNCANGIFSKKPFIEKYIAKFRPSAFFISECDIRGDHLIDLLNIKGYKVEVSRTLELKNKGRVMVYIKEGSGLTRIANFEEDCNDLIVLKQDHTLIVGIYAGFKTEKNETVQTNFERLLKNLKNVCDKSKSIVIGGDFNADPQRNDTKSKVLDLWQTDCGLEQHVKEFTRSRIVSDVLQTSLIDHVYSKELLIKDLKVLPSEVSDHSLVLVKVPLETPVPIKFQKVIVIDWRKFSEQRMNQVLIDCLDTLTPTASPDVFNRDLTVVITEAMNKIIPKRVMHVRRDSDIHSYKIEALKKKRDRLFKEARKTGCINVMSKVKELNKAIKKLVVKEKKNLIANKMKNSSPVTFWSTINGLLGREKDANSYNLKTEKGFLSVEETVQTFADFFDNKVKALVAKNPIEDIEVPAEVKLARAPEFSMKEIEVAISSFKPKRSSGPDEIPMTIIKTCFDVLKNAIFYLFKLINESGRIPSVWRVARVKPILKKAIQVTWRTTGLSRISIR
jgi:exonuclease III